MDAEMGNYVGGCRTVALLGARWRTAKDIIKLIHGESFT
jgi:hypothetical protein